MTPSPDNARIGVAEWYFTTQEMGKALEVCPRFMETPDGAQLRGARAASGNALPPWVRAFEFRSDKDRYAGELWFVIVPDAAVNPWLQKKVGAASRLLPTSRSHPSAATRWCPRLHPPR